MGGFLLTILKLFIFYLLLMSKHITVTQIYKEFIKEFFHTISLRHILMTLYKFSNGTGASVNALME